MTLSAHDSTAVYVQPRSGVRAYKLVNPGGVVGTVDTDAIPGISASSGSPRRP
jgi:predicted methyltransferase